MLAHRPHLPGLLAVLSTALAGGAHAQTTWYVDDDAPGPGTGTFADPYPSIQTAITATTTAPGDTIDVAPGTYGAIDFSGKALAIVGGAGRTISGGNALPCVVAANGEGPGTSIEGFVLRDGRGRLGALNTSRGGGFFVEGAHLLVDDCLVTQNDSGPGLSSEGGGAAAVGGATLTVRDTQFEANDGVVGGGLFAEASQVTLEDCAFRQNRGAQGGFGGMGGGLYATGGTLRVERTLFEQNLAFMGGGASVGGGTMEFVQCTFRANTAAMGCFQGGALDGSGYVEECLFQGNFGQFGGAVHGDFEVVDSTFVDNSFDQIEANFGGAFHSGGSGSLASATGCLFQSNVCWGQGGATHGVALFDSVLRNNIAFEDDFNSENGLGAGAYLGTANGCLFEGNRTIDSGSPFLDDQGGGAHSAILFLCILRGNRSSEGGGAYACSVDRCTVVENVATVAGGGLIGGTLVRSTIARDNVPSQIESLVAGLPQVSFSNVESGFAGNGNFDADPEFYGPLSGDFHLLPTSPCIDTGDPNGVDPDGTRADVGALPFDPNYLGAPGRYCDAKVTSAGCLPFSVATGNASLTGSGFTSEVHAVLGGTVGLVFWARAAADAPYAGGTLCIGGSFVRTAPVAATGSSGCDGVLSRDFTAAELTAAGLMPGERIYLQWFFRDAAQPDGTGLGLSDGLEATVTP